MEEFTQEITAHNLGEKQAQLSYAIREITILGTTYSVDEDTTSDDLKELIESDNYPFHIRISIENDGLIEPEVGISKITISVTWPFEQEDDELDTYWGELAYEYYQENPEGVSINMKIELKAVQI